MIEQLVAKTVQEEKKLAGEDDLDDFKEQVVEQMKKLDLPEEYLQAIHNPQVLNEIKEYYERATFPETAIEQVEQRGIIFIDEIDKLCGNKFDHSSDVSGEGVQRELLPLIEGTTVSTKFGDINTSNILFIVAGAFLKNKPTDLISELLGRLPIRERLNSLTRNDIYRILTEPKYNIITQNIALFRTEDIDLRFSDDAIVSISEYTEKINEKVEDIGARRLFSVMEILLEEYSFHSKVLGGKTIIIHSPEVDKKLSPQLISSQSRKYIL
eukprot:TRINITY_DN3548_c0_g1_i1.p1 TRINITY_DN3548_c0_g1~~TRINITY_DN3548_c0_g1_i1.p1  ORF type:complete len:269 (+),score=54.74 TRINITY_DN3548_c0_g1_i1:644-1450(+)